MAHIVLWALCPSRILLVVVKNYHSTSKIQTNVIRQQQYFGCIQHLAVLLNIMQLWQTGWKPVQERQLVYKL